MKIYMSRPPLQEINSRTDKHLLIRTQETATTTHQNGDHISFDK